MEFAHFSHNGEVRPIEEAVVPLSNIEYSYGFGVYETIRVVGGEPNFLPDHLERLMESARLIGLEHTYDEAGIGNAIKDLIEKNAVESCNLKLLLIGGKSADDATLDILCLNPLYPDKKLYARGIHTITYPYEREFSHAKTLNMLQSYLAYRKAKEAGAYDALLLARDGTLLEGTRTNFFCLKGKKIVSAPEERILLGVTRKYMLQAARGAGFAYEERAIRPDDLPEYDAAFLTSTSSKIMPIASVDDFAFGARPEALEELMQAFDTLLDSSEGRK